MKIIVTGSAGFIGSNLAQMLSENKYEVFGYDDLSFGDIKNIRGHIRHFEIPFQQIEQKDVDDTDVLVHCATSNIIYAQTNFIETIKNNALDTISLFSRFKNKIVNISTASVYGNADNLPTKESDEIKCSNAYDTSKRLVELYLEQRGNFTTLRLSNVYSTNQRISDYCGVVAKMIYSALKGEPLNVIGGSQTRDFTYVADVVDAIIKSVELPACNTEINIASGTETSIVSLTRMIKTFGYKNYKDFSVNVIPPRSIDTISRRCLDITKAKELLGWEPKTSLTEGIKKTIEWMKEEYPVS